MLSGAELIRAERHRQECDEGFTTEHDDAHVNCELLAAAICYLVLASDQIRNVYGPELQPVQPVPAAWPWEPQWWKPSVGSIRNLVKAGALIAAEIDRLERDDLKKARQDEAQARS